MVPTEHARLYLPDKPLRRYTALAVERDTRGQNLTDPQRFNYYPASPFATLSWIWTGQIQQVEDWDAGTEPRLGEVMPQLVFSGPFTRPSASWSPGPVHALMVGLYPEFVAGVLGVSPEDYCNRIVPLEQVTPALPAWFVAVCQAVLQAPEAPFACWQQQLGQHLHTGQLASPRPTLSGWLQSLALQVAMSQSGASLRQLQRTVRRLTGQSYRQLQLYQRTEQAFGQLTQSAEHSASRWASLAAESGYADQSHLGREVRRMTGFSPARLEAMMQADEAFWFYRLLWQHHRTLPEIDSPQA